MSNTIEQTVAEIRSQPSNGMAKDVRRRWDSLTKPRGSLGKLEDAVVKLALIQDATMPRVERRGLYVFCGDHGIAEEGVSAYPSAVTREMVKNFVRGGAAINVLCRRYQIETRVVDAGVAGEKITGVIDRRIGDGTRNFLKGPAMSRTQATAALESGIALASEAATLFDIVGTGEMGIGNTTSASALLCVFAGVTSANAAGRGAGLDDAGLQRKRDVLTEALSRHTVSASDPLSVAGAFGGFEIVMLAGFLLGAARHRLPVVVDGFIVGAAFLLARAFFPALGDHVFFAHVSAESGHASLLAAAGAQPLLDLGMRLGEGTGAVLAMELLTTAVSLYRDMATFAEASVSDVTA